MEEEVEGQGAEVEEGRYQSPVLFQYIRQLSLREMEYKVKSSVVITWFLTKTALKL